MKKIIKFFSIISLTLHFTICHYSRTDTDPSYSSFVDPEEIYSLGKALGDIGVYNEMDFNGNNIKIGILENGIPQGLSLLEKMMYCHGTHETEHATKVFSVLKTIAPNATYYFASKEDYGFENCVNWLINTRHVDIINHSAAFLAVFDGKYSYDSSRYIDKIIHDSGVIFVNSVGNNDSSINMASVSLGINVISSAANDRNLNFASINSREIIDNFETKISKPTCLTPGELLYGYDFQDMSIKDEANGISIIETGNSSFLTGTSFSSPMVCGIVALLLQEFPLYNGHPEVIQSIISSSISEDGILNYQLARESAKNIGQYVIQQDVSDNDVLYTAHVNIPTNCTIHMGSFVLFNDLVGHTNPIVSEVLLDEIQYSKLKISIIDSNDTVVFEEITSYSNAAFEYKNLTELSEFTIVLSISGSKPLNGVEKACFSFRVSNIFDNLMLNFPNLYLDEAPTLNWNIINFNNPSEVSLVFRNYKNQIILKKENLSPVGSYSLSMDEWNELIDLRGREFYAYLKLVDTNNTYYSRQYLLQEPKNFMNLSNMNPSDFNFQEQYFFYPITTYHTVGETYITVERLRCGYIEEQYLNLSAKRANAGHAYLQLTFNKKISYLSFGVTLWKAYELLSISNDTAIVEILNESNSWVEAIDLLNDLVMPYSRKDVIRFAVTNIYGIRFDVTSVPSGKRNDGRLCIDNIAFTDDPTYNCDLSDYYEPIVVRETFQN